MIHLRLVDKDGQPLRLRPHRGRNGSRLRKSPVVESAFLSDDWSLTVTGSDLPEDVEADYFTFQRL